MNHLKRDEKVSLNTIAIPYNFDVANKLIPS